MRDLLRNISIVDTEGAFADALWQAALIATDRRIEAERQRQVVPLP